MALNRNNNNDNQNRHQQLHPFFGGTFFDDGDLFSPFIPSSIFSRRRRGDPFLDHFFRRGGGWWDDPFGMDRVMNEFQSSMTTTSLGYDIRETNDGKEYAISVDVPGIKPSDLNVELQDDGRVVRIWGGRKHVVHHPPATAAIEADGQGKMAAETKEKDGKTENHGP